MSDQTQSATTLLRYQVDNSSLSSALDANSKVAASYSDIADAAAQLGLSVDQLSTMAGGAIDTGLTTPLNNASTSARNVIRDLDELATKQREIASLPDPSFGSFEGEDSSGGGGGINPRAFTTAGRLVGGPAGHALRAVGQASRLADMLPEDSDALLQLGLAAGIAAPAIIGVALAFNQFTQDIQKGKDQLTAGISAQDTYYKALGSSSTKQVQTQVQDLNNRQKFLKQEIDETQKARDQSFALTQGLAGDAAARVLEAAGLAPGKQLQDQLDALNKEYGTNTQTVERLSQGLQNGAFVANDATDILNALAAAQADANKELAEYNKRISDQISSYADLITQEVDLHQDVFDTETKITQLRTDANAKETDLLTTENENIASIQADAAQKQQQIVQDNADAISKIIRDGGRAEKTAIGNRDAESFRLAAQKETDSLSDQQKTEAKQETQLAASTAKQEATVKASYDKQVRQIETSLAQQTDIQRRHLQQDQVDLQNTVNAEIGVAINGSSGLYRIHQSMWADLGALAGEGVANILNSVRSLVQNSAAIIQSPYNPYTYGLPGVTGYQPMTTSKVQSIVRNQLTGYLGLNNPGGNSLR